MYSLSILLIESMDSKAIVMILSLIWNNFHRGYLSNEKRTAEFAQYYTEETLEIFHTWHPSNEIKLSTWSWHYAIIFCTFCDSVVSQFNWQSVELLKTLLDIWSLCIIYHMVLISVFSIVKIVQITAIHCSNWTLNM